jgi:hypothetical protein
LQFVSWPQNCPNKSTASRTASTLGRRALPTAIRNVLMNKDKPYREF